MGKLRESLQSAIGLNQAEIFKEMGGGRRGENTKATKLSSYWIRRGQNYFTGACFFRFVQSLVLD